MHHSKQKNSSVNKQNNLSKGLVRIIGGEMRGRKLHFRPIEGLRPTLDRIRETLFNWLARDITNSHCLDLFAGSGALGFEALSRGASRITLVEQSKKVVDDLMVNCQRLDSNNIKIVNLEALKFLQSTDLKFNIVFLDPPFGNNLLEKTVSALIPRLSENALIYIEQENSETPFEPDDRWQKLKYKNTGNFSYALYQLI